MHPISTWLKSAAWLAVVAWAGTVFWLSSQPGEKIEEMNVFHVWDKAAHFTAYLAGAAALVIALRWSTTWTWLRLAFCTAIAISLYGASDEYHQLYTPHRSGADPGDWLADTLGGTAGTLLTAFAYARFNPASRTAPPRA